MDRSQRRNRPLRRRLPRRQNTDIKQLLRQQHARNPRQRQNHLSGLGHPRQRRAKGSSFTGYTNTPVLSFITANFNSNKLAGEIRGNSDYGPSVKIENATISGPSFSGNATSGGKTGNLEGKFFGKFNGSYGNTETSIGGKITFKDDRSLDTVFGGVSYVKKLDETANRDTEHLTKQ